MNQNVFCPIAFIGLVVLVMRHPHNKFLTKISELSVTNA